MERAHLLSLNEDQNLIDESNEIASQLTVKLSEQTDQLIRCEENQREIQQMGHQSGALVDGLKQKIAHYRSFLYLIILGELSAILYLSVDLIYHSFNR